MQTSVNRKKYSDSFQELTQYLHFAICPYAINLFSQMDSIFTLNFEKNHQIVGELSTMIYPELDKSHIELEPLKNVMMFRIFKNFQSDYRWTLYERNQNGKQQMTQTIKVNLTQETNKLIADLKSSTKTKLHDSKSLSNSSKMLESIYSNKASEKIHSPKNSLKTSNMKTPNKAIPSKKQIQNTNFNYVQSVSTNELNGTKLGIKQMKSKFSKSLLEVQYLFCIGSNQVEIKQAVKCFHLQSKFSMINKSFKQADQLIGPQIRTHQPHMKLQLIEEQLQITQRRIQNPLKINLSSKELTSNDLPNENLSVYRQESKVNEGQSNQDYQANQPQYFQNNIHRQVMQTKNSAQPESNQDKPYDAPQIKEKDLSQLTNRHKTSIHQLDSIDSQQKNPDQLNDLSITQKMHTKMEFHVDLTQDRQLVQTTPNNTIHEKNASRLAPKSITYTDQSNLKLDDVILNGKRISLSDKSQWMITSKSKTSEYDRTQKSNPTQKNNPRHKDQPKDFHLANNNFQVYSRNQDEISLDLVSANPRQKNPTIPTNEDKFTLEMQNDPKDDKIQQRHENIVKQSSILVIGNRFKPKRKSTAEDFPTNKNRQNRIKLKNKPKTMEDQTIRFELRTIKGQLRDGNWVDKDETHQEQQIHTPMFRHETKQEQNFKKLIPSMIDENVEIRRSGQLFQSNSGQDPDLFNPKLDDSFDWGQGLSEIKQESVEKQFSLINVNGPLDKLYKASHFYAEKYIQPVKENFLRNPYCRGAQTLAAQHLNLKYILLIICVMLLLTWISGQLYPSNQADLIPVSKKKQQKKVKPLKRKK